MSFSRHTSRIYCDEVDIEGAINVFRKRIISHPEYESLPYYQGALTLLEFMSNLEDIRDQSVLMDLFDGTLKADGLEPIPAVERGEEN